MPPTATSPTDFEVMQSLARAPPAHVDALPDGTEIVGAIRAEVESAHQLPEFLEYGSLVAAILELLRTPELSPEQSATLRESFFGAE